MMMMWGYKNQVKDKAKAKAKPMPSHGSHPSLCGSHQPLPHSLPPHSSLCRHSLLIPLTFLPVVIPWRSPFPFPLILLRIRFRGSPLFLLFFLFLETLVLFISLHGRSGTWRVFCWCRWRMIMADCELGFCELLLRWRSWEVVPGVLEVWFVSDFICSRFGNWIWNANPSWN